MTTNDIPVLPDNVQAAVLQLQTQLQTVAPNWHGLTAIHGIIIVAFGWITHANWDKVLSVYFWIKSQRGFFGIGANLLWGGKQAAPAVQVQTPPTITAPTTSQSQQPPQGGDVTPRTV